MTTDIKIRQSVRPERHTLGVGMFDSYRPVPPINCPACSADSDGDWQGKDGPCCLLIWTQGVRRATNGDIAEESKLGSEDLESMSLPERFAIYCRCVNGHWIDAQCVSEDGVWASTQVVE